MKISLQTNYTRATFTAKKKEIRKADDIQRKSRKNFPMFSPSYLLDFYCLNKEETSKEKQARTAQIAQRIVYKINAGRIADKEYNKYINAFRKELPYIRRLDRLKQSKIGNCHEAAIATMATLAANGYEDIKRLSLRQKTEYVDKKTDKVVFSKDYDIDHTFLVSAMGKENPKEKDLIVFDSWMGFADSISKAKEKYSCFIDEKKNLDDFKDSFSLFRREHFQKTGIFLEKSDLYIRHKIIFEKEEEPTEKEMQELGKYARMMYPHLCL